MARTARAKTITGLSVHEPTARRRLRAIASAGRLAIAALAGAALPLPSPTLAQTPVMAAGSELAPRLRQSHHTRWTRAEGGPTGATALAQTQDGFLWIAADSGLLRFDGLRFELIEAAAPGGRPISLFTERNGDLWMWYSRSQTFSIYRDGVIRPVPGPGTDGIVTLFAQTTDGAVWVGLPQHGKPVYRFHQGMRTRIDPPADRAPDYLLGMVATADGALWLSYVNSVRRIPAGARQTEHVLDTPDANGDVELDRQGRVWLVERNRVRQISGPGGSLAFTPEPPSALPDERRPPHSLIDREGRLWRAGRSEGVTRIQLPGAAERRRVDELEVYVASDGLSSNVGGAILEDREGNIWVGTSAGLDRFRRAPITLERQLTRPAAYGDLLTSGADGSVYVAQADAVYRIRPHGRPERLTALSTDAEGLCEGPDGTIWVVTHEGILGLNDGRQRTLPRPPEVFRAFYDCAFGPDGRLWLGAGALGLLEYDQGGWRSASIPPGAMLAFDGRGDLWTSSGPNLDRLSGGQWSSVSGLTSDDAVHAVFPARGGLLVAGLKGVGRVVNDRITPLTDAAPLAGATGILETPAGETWAFSSAGLVRLAPGELEAAHREQRAPRFRIFDHADGLPERYPNQTWRALVQGGDGRIWAATLAGTAWIDPLAIPRNPVAPSLAITAMEANGVVHRDPAGLRLPAGVMDLALSFSALSLSVPERVQVRYRLEGHDRDWVDPGVRRQAFYTNLTPGTYRFQVIAANEDGVWNRSGATLEFVIPPTFVQSVWFKLLCGLVLLALGWAAYALRIRVLTGRMRARFQVRIAERERIARELHDTLLQGFQGLVLQFQAVASGIPSDGKLRGSVEEALDRADAVLVEGRARVRELRSDTETGDLPRDLATAAREIGESEAVQVDLRVMGSPRELQALVGEELLRIAEEALRNAARHSGADRVGMVLSYGPHVLSLVVEDAGAGVPEAVRTGGGCEGHYGLVGMRERATRISGRFTLSGGERKGTRIAVTLPASSAYSDSRWTDRLPGFLRWPRPT